jgi:hypothetical protein
MSSTTTNPLAQDLAAFEDRKASLQSQVGKFAVFFKGELLGVFDTNQEAYTKGYEKAKIEPFLVRQISPVPNIQHFTRAIRFQCLTSS